MIYMAEKGKYYRVITDLFHTPLPDPMLHGYATRQMFYIALKKVVKKWRGRVGECIGERHDFLLLRFHDTPGGKPEEAWLPKYLLNEEEGQVQDDMPDETIEALNRAFGFD